ncbi:DUF4434 domain-containing protein [Nonomuraea sediminis]|uniref:DUF4434 domain-containing protein n=1 Tax=Nonomuraea sediminis TaxID=2835864 RepID=UPI001BDDB473|nr:DUF4434 domain-containing protein [Nonomuraea sediminis]
MTYKKITGTFIDEITVDIPSQNWGPQEWEREFDTFAEAGLDTVVLIRAGCGERLACPSKAVSDRVATLPVYVDLVRLFLDLSEARGIGFYLGLYDSNHFWYRHDWRTEVEINRAFIAEMWERYGDSPAFRGWYLPHETTDSSLRILDINTTLAEQAKSSTGLPVLISPYYMGRKDIAGAQPVRTPEEHRRIWEEIFGRYQGLVDACAFQDATTDLLQLEEYTKATVEAARGTGIAIWSNAETFDRDMPIRFPPTDWRKLAHRLDTVQPYVDKIITFEFPHFMSPNSMWPSAQALYRRYQDLIADRTR